MKQQIKRSSIMSFGKYVSRTVGWVLVHDPQYLLWANEVGAIRLSYRQMEYIIEYIEDHLPSPEYGRTVNNHRYSADEWADPDVLGIPNMW